MGCGKQPSTRKIMRNITGLVWAMTLGNLTWQTGRDIDCGAGKHLDKRTKRLRTRGAQLRRLFNE